MVENTVAVQGVKPGRKRMIKSRDSWMMAELFGQPAIALKDKGFVSLNLGSFACPTKTRTVKCSHCDRGLRGWGPEVGA